VVEDAVAADDDDDAALPVDVAAAAAARSAGLTYFGALSTYQSRCPQSLS